MNANNADIPRALVVHVTFGRGRDADEHAEFIELARSAGLDIAASVMAARQAPEPNFLVGRGKADAIATEAGASRADVIIFNHALTPAQERNLEQHTRRRVIDRIGLILDIFAQRALSHAGKLQVELAPRHASAPEQRAERGAVQFAPGQSGRAPACVTGIDLAQ